MYFTCESTFPASAGQFYGALLPIKDVNNKYEGSYDCFSIILSNSKWQRFSVEVDSPIFAKRELQEKMAILEVTFLSCRRLALEAGPS